MPKSRFETIFKHRESIEDKAKIELAVIKSSLEEEEERLASYNRLQRNSLKGLHQKQIKGAEASEVLLYVSFLNGLSNQIKRQRRIIEETNIKFNRKLEELVEASKKKKIVMKIMEKELEEHLLEELRKEQGFMDEIGISRYNQNKRIERIGD